MTSATMVDMHNTPCHRSTSNNHCTLQVTWHASAFNNTWELLVCCRSIGFVSEECSRVAWPVPGGIVAVRTSAARGARASRHCQHAEVVRPVSQETSSQVCVPRRPDLTWSGPFRLRHPHNSGLPDATREVDRPIQPETSSKLSGSEMP